MRFESAQQAICDAFRLGSPGCVLGAQGGGAADVGYRLTDAMEASKVVALVRSLPPVQSLWLLYVYTDSLADDGDAEGAVIAWLLDQLAKAPPMTLDFTMASRVMHLLLILVQEARGLYRNSAPRRSDADLAAMVFGSRDARTNFKRGLPWRRLSDSVRWHLGALDGEALEPVAALVDDLFLRSEAA